MIWVDVTTLLWWSRGPVGIVRTELECAAHALRRDGAVRFCSFSGDRIVEVPSQQVTERISAIIQRSTRSTPEPASAVPKLRISRARRIASTVRTLVRKLPSPLEQTVLRFVRPRLTALREILHGVRAIKSGTTGLIRPPSILGPSPNAETTKLDFPFADGDAYVSLGLDWDDKRNDVLFRLKRSGKVRIVRICYDMIPVKFPHFTGLPDRASVAMSRYFVDMLWTADLVLCISQQTQADLLSFAAEAGTPEPRTSIVRLGADLRAEQAPMRASLRDQPFILFVSTIERRKNHEVLVRAYARLVEEGMGASLPRLVFVGMVGWGVSDLVADILYDPRVKELISILDGVDDRELSTLYDRCLFTVFPSFWEGWGLGVAESLARGKFCIASNAGSLPEVGGNFVAYVDPLDTLGWVHTLRHYITNPDEVRQREGEIQSRYRNTTWADAADGIFAAAGDLALGENPSADVKATNA